MIDQGVYYSKTEDHHMVVIAFVDDIFIGSDSPNAIKLLKEFLKSKFGIKELGELTMCLGMEIKRDRSAKTTEITQSFYIDTLLKRFGLTDSDPSPNPPGGDFDSPDSNQPKAVIEPCDKSLYQQLIGSLMYLVICTRPDISYYVGKLARKMISPTTRDLQYGQHLLRYVKHTRANGLKFSANPTCINKLLCYVDANWAGENNRDDINGIAYRSTSGYTILMNGAAISTMSKLQSLVAHSTAEAEYVALSSATLESAFLKNLLDELHFSQPPVTILEDNNACIKIAQNENSGSKVRHINIRYHGIHDYLKQGIIQIKKVSTKDNLADSLTKATTPLKFKTFHQTILGHSPVFTDPHLETPDECGGASAASP